MRIKIVEELTAERMDELASLYKQEGWTKDRQLADIQIMLKHCQIIGLIDEDANKLVGITRIVTDYMYRATVYDVIVLNEYHGLGLGRLLLETLINHPRLKHIEKIDLYCAEEKIEFYNKWGFNEIPATTHFLRRAGKQD